MAFMLYFQSRRSLEDGRIKPAALLSDQVAALEVLPETANNFTPNQIVDDLVFLLLV